MGLGSYCRVLSLVQNMQTLGQLFEPLYIWKPDLNLINNSTLTVDEISWWSPKVLAEYTKESFQPTKCLRKTMDSKAYITFLEQPWRQFVLGLSICNGVKLRIHFYDKSGSAISLPFNIHTHPEWLIYILSAVTFGGHGCIGFDTTMEIKPVPAWIQGLLAFLAHDTDIQSATTLPIHKSTSLLITSSSNDSPGSPPAIGTMLIGDDLYEIIDILFSSPGFLGRGRVCYLTWRNNVLYIIKDHWV